MLKCHAKSLVSTPGRCAVTLIWKQLGLFLSYSGLDMRFSVTADPDHQCQTVNGNKLVSGGKDGPKTEFRK